MRKGTENEREILSRLRYTGVDREEMIMSKSVKYCENCGAEIEPGAKFCESCGTPVVIDPPSRSRSTPPPRANIAPPPAPSSTHPPVQDTPPPAAKSEVSGVIYCSSCGTANTAGSKFCNSCGVSLIPGQVAAAPPPPAPSAVAPSPVSDTAPKAAGKTSGAWWFLPLFFGLVGGLIAWALVKENDNSKAKKLLFFGIFITVFWFIISIVILVLDYVLFY